VKSAQAPSSSSRRPRQAMTRWRRCLPRSATGSGLSLSPLSQPDTVALVRMLAPTHEATTVERLSEQVWIASEGNPFMVVETMRALQEGAAARDVALPQRVREVIGRRLERLADGSRSLLTVASVIGREFEFELLRRAAGLDEDATAEGVEERPNEPGDATPTPPPSGPAYRRRRP